MIDLKDALKQIKAKDFRDKRGTFSIVFMTCHIDKETGGELRSFKTACGCGLPPNSKGHEMVGVMDMETHKRYAVHNRLIFEFNNDEVFWV